MVAATPLVFPNTAGRADVAIGSQLGNLAELTVDAGVLYYVIVVAENTGNLAQPYSIVIIEKE